MATFGRKRGLLLAVAATLLVVGSGYTYEGPALSLPRKIIPVPLIRQKTDFSCGDVSVLAILRYWNHQKYKQVPEKALYKPLETTSRSGTEPTAMAEFLNREPGLRAELRMRTPTLQDLERAVDRGEPAIVNIQAWQDVKRFRDLKPWATDWDDGHYVVLVGYDRNAFYFMDPSTTGHYTYIPRSELLSRWHDVLGPRSLKVQRIVVFVRSALTPYRPVNPLPPRVTRLN